MSWIKNHYYSGQFRNHLKELGIVDDLKLLTDVDAEANTAINKRCELYYSIFEKNKHKLTPLLRPCHQEEGDNLQIYVEGW